VCEFSELERSTVLLDWTTGLDYWTGLYYTEWLDWTTEVDYWTDLDYMLTYLPTSSPDCCDSFQVTLCMGSTNSLKCRVPYFGRSFSYTVVLPLQQWNKVSTLKGHCIYSREFLWGDFFSLV